MTRDEIINMARAAWKAALAQPETTAANYDLDAMAEAFSRVIEAHHSSTHPFHNPIDADAKIALRTLRGLIPGIKACARPPRDKWREAVIGALEICMILNDANRDDPERAMSDLMEWEPRDEWRPASEPPEVPEDAMFSRGAVAAIVAGALYSFGAFLTARSPAISIGETEACGPVVDLISAFAEQRGLSLDNPAVLSWHLCIGRDVTPPTEGRP